jgi:hypothetical protein
MDHGACISKSPGVFVMSDGGRAADKRVEVYTKAIRKKSRYMLGLVVGIIFVAVGFFISEVIVFGGLFIVIISIANLAAVNHAEKRLEMISAANGISMQRSAPRRTPEKTASKECRHCGKKIGLNSIFCEECGEKQ